LKLLNRLDGGARKIMWKAARPSSGMDSSNPHRWRGERLHYGDVVCHVVVLFVPLFVLFVPSRLVVISRCM
jgi:hypothetical protein